MVSVGLSVTCKKLTMRHYDFSRTHLQGTAHAQIRVLAEGQQKFGEDMVGRLAERMYATLDASHTCQLDCMSLIFAESLVSFEEASTVRHCSAVLTFSARLAVLGHHFACLADDSGLRHSLQSAQRKIWARLVWTKETQQSFFF